MKGLKVGYHMVARHDEQDRRRIGRERRQRNRGGGVAPERLQYDVGTFDADRRQLFDDDFRMIGVRDDERRIEERIVSGPQSRKLQHRPLFSQGEQLLGLFLTRQGPEACPGTAGKNDRRNFGLRNIHYFSVLHGSSAGQITGMAKAGPGDHINGAKHPIPGFCCGPVLIRLDQDQGLPNAVASNLTGSPTA